MHWQHHTPVWRLEHSGGKDLGLIESYDAQLSLIFLLDFLRGHEQSALKMKLVQADVGIGGLGFKKPTRRKWPHVPITKDHLEAAGVESLASADTASMVRPACKGFERTAAAPTVRYGIAGRLPERETGLGATEHRMLELLSGRKASPRGLFPGYKHRNKRRVFYYWEVGELLDGLAHCPAPAIDGLNEGPFTMELHDDRERLRRYGKSGLSLTALGKAIAAQTEDFSRHNPIHRWWGGTELNNDRLWRWDTANRVLVAP